ncbi:NAD(P)H-dependent glycerol-3-phosphate dehydrogenase [Rubellimicrobium sp. CFH 75288]|uniref:NAD(P)H-dependent glycerol-3-phosphate dehydrogenase n=1 Tax=Rubellimicrobium sp. CFH 75288 TaxID=2697034 RepID=UPI0014124D2B|nr:NAD(P)H-dependent glycerol-3-phosphate dehydrogenase [Rubellimicrobium sp. CFH 75288]NAZ37800.1 NAD(P)H-dependent glycerol-3-phosphate dehydrogenase [Rubellimicrobium sp. CFH 75288]
MSRVAVIGSGAFGAALAIALAAQHDVVLWGRETPLMERARQERRLPRLPGAILPDRVQPTGDLGAVRGAEAVLLAVPAQALREFLAAQRTVLAGAAPVACCKGIDLATGEGPSALIAAALPGSRPALLTGPSFAADIARGRPAALTLACRDEAEGARLQALLSTPTLRLYRTPDVTGAELGGALKNVVAIACGACIGAGFGESARAALLARGFAETVRLARHLGAQESTLMGLSGLGDLVLTATSEESRNFRFGLALGRGEGFAPDVTVEGAATARAALALAARCGIEMPVTAAVAGLVEGRLDAETALRLLLERPLRTE